MAANLDSSPQSSNPASRATLPLEAQAALARGATLLTANQRSARFLRSCHADFQRVIGLKAWVPPAILSWSAWTHSLWQQLLLDGHEDRLLLSSPQEHAAWTSILSADQALKTLHRLDSLADLAQQAWSSLAAALGLHRLRECSGSVDAESFARWAVEFNRRCKRERWLSAAQLDEALAEAIVSRKLLPNPAEFALVGFDRMSPAQAALCQALRDGGHGCQPLLFAPPASKEPPVAVVAESHEEEAMAAAWWARQRLEANPEARIAIILPNIAARRDQLDRVFRSVLAPEQANIDAAQQSSPFEFSLGHPLVRQPMTAAALALLKWPMQPLPFDHFSHLLLSPFFASANSTLADRARFDAFLRHEQMPLQPEVSLAPGRLDWLLSAMAPATSLSTLRQQLISAQRIARDAGLFRDSAAKTHTEWAVFISDFLSAIGWPGARPLDSHEFQLLDKWHALLDESATLDAANFAANSTPHVSYNTALETIERLAAETLFAPQSSDAPVQIMGVLESSGSAFDALWFLGATDADWPTAARTAPFLPWQTQRSLKMPNSDPAADYQRAANITRRILASAPFAVFSHARREGKLEFRPSPLLAELESTTPLDATFFVPSDWHPYPSAAEMEDFDGEGPIAPPPDSLRRGSTLLQLQSQCPFRAFAEQRLHSAEPEFPDIGLNHRQRGTLVHETLKHFWTHVLTQEALAGMEPAERADMLAFSADFAFAKLPQPLTSWEAAYLRIQRDWLIRLLDQWMDAELARPPFKVLLREDVRKDVPIGPLHLNLRLDRVDEVDGRLVFLDYKTGDCAPKDWLGERPEDPQLPLYAATATSSAPSTLAGLAFARVRVGEMCLSGWSTGPGILKQSKFKKNGDPAVATEVREDIPAQVAEWKRILEALAEEFHRGAASVTPKNYPKTCEHCGQRPFCRVAESALAREAAAEDIPDESSGDSAVPQAEGGDEAAHA